jgi:hypothetical protein
LLRLKDVLGDLYRDRVPDPMNITKVEWEVILRYMGADSEAVSIMFNFENHQRSWGGARPLVVPYGVLNG